MVQSFRRHGSDLAPLDAPGMSRACSVLAPIRGGLQRLLGGARAGSCAGGSCCSRSSTLRSSGAPRAGCRTGSRSGIRRGTALEALDEPVLLRLARRDVVPGATTLLLPAPHGVGGQLGAVVADDHCRAATQCHDTVEFTPDPQPGQRRVHDQRWFFPCGSAIGARVQSARLRPPRRRKPRRSARCRRNSFLWFSRCPSRASRICRCPPNRQQATPKPKPSLPK